MLKVRVIPTLLLKQFGLVKGKCFDSSRRVGPILPAIKVYNHREVDELIIMDVGAQKLGVEPDYETIEDLSKDCFVPLTVGGGITTAEHVQKLLRAGADKISINSVAYLRPDIINEICRIHGQQCVVVSIDVRGSASAGWDCFSNAGTIRTNYQAVQWAREVADRGAGEILLTSINRDGSMEGYDLDLIAAVSSAVNIPVIASGGAGSYADMVRAVKQAGASAVAAASMFHFTEQTPEGAKKSLAAAGIPVRRSFY